ncbi:MAG: aldo/keto reductase [Verrucomicrobiales bacterium]
MTKLKIGSSGLLSSRIAYGCWRIGGFADVTDLAAEREAAGRVAIRTAYDAGITLYDHADIYNDGMAETVFGGVLKDAPGMRKNMVIASKCGIRKGGTPNAAAPYRYDFSADYIIKSCEGSLKRLGIETIDLYQLHRPDFLAQPEEVARAFSQLKQQGKVREFGLSNARPSFFRLLQKFCPMPLIVNQVEISLVKLDTFSDGTLDHCMTEGITPLAWSPLGGGKLAFSAPIDLNEPNHARRIKLRETMDLIARERDCSRTVVAIAWLLAHPSKIIPIIGSTDPNNIRDLLNAEETPLSREEWYRLMEAACGQRLP